MIIVRRIHIQLLRGILSIQQARILFAKYVILIGGPMKECITLAT